MENLDIFKILEDRFNKNMHRHLSLIWNEVLEKLDDSKVQVLKKMEETGGEPDVIVFENDIIFVDFSKETPKERRNCCYDEKARLNRKKFPPEYSVESLLREIGCELVCDKIYSFMQNIEDLDLKTSSWINTDDDIRKLGGAIFGDKRYNRTFFYHNGADSYYSSRRFRGFLKII